MRIRIDGREVAQPSKYPLGLVYEAEKYLGVSVNDGSTAQTMVALFLALREDDPDHERHPVDIATEVKNADMMTVEEVEEEDPPAEGEASPEDPPSTGTPPSDPSE